MSRKTIEVTVNASGDVERPGEIHGEVSVNVFRLIDEPEVFLEVTERGGHGYQSTACVILTPTEARSVAAALIAGAMEVER